VTVVGIDFVAASVDPEEMSRKSNRQHLLARKIPFYLERRLEEKCCHLFSTGSRRVRRVRPS
jgi:hypothetical protein